MYHDFLYFQTFVDDIGDSATGIDNNRNIDGDGTKTNNGGADGDGGYSGNSDGHINLVGEGIDGDGNIAENGDENTTTIKLEIETLHLPQIANNTEDDSAFPVEYMVLDNTVIETIGSSFNIIEIKRI